MGRFAGRQVAVAGVLLAVMCGSLPVGAALQRPDENAPPRPLARMPAGVKAHRDLAYVEGGHARQKLDLYLPAPAKADAGAAPLPVIVWVHGGGWQSGNKSQCLPLRMGFVERGYAVASVGYRLSGDAPFPAQIEDVKAAVRWLRAHAKEYGLDAARFGAWGSSAGGHLVALLGTSGGVAEFDKPGADGVSSAVQAVCDYYGPTDLARMVQTRGYERHAAADSPEGKLLGGAVLENRERAARANPIAYVDKNDPPYLIVHGDSDPVVPLNQSQLLFDALKEAKVPVRFHTVRGARHGGPEFAAPEVAQMVAAFFDRTLKGKDAVPVPPEALSTEGGTSPVPSAPAAKGATLPADFRLEGARWSYRDGDATVSGILLKPEGRGPFPAVLISHGLGGSADGFGLETAREMVKWGYVCVAPDYTHSARELSTHRAAPAGAGAGGRAGAALRGPAGAPPRRRVGAFADLGASTANLRRARTCLDIVRTLPEVDGSRLFAYGNSMGGFVTIGLAAAEPGLLRAAAITASGVGPYAGSPGPSVETARGIKAPFLILHGSADTVVRPAQSAALKAALDAGAVPNERYVFPGEGHPIVNRRRNEVFRRLRAWFDRHGASPTDAAAGVAAGSE